jgi:hypothetical protein
MGGGKYDLINRGPEGKTFKIELLPKIICKEKSGITIHKTLFRISIHKNHIWGFKKTKGKFLTFFIVKYS